MRTLLVALRSGQHIQMRVKDAHVKRNGLVAGGWELLTAGADAEILFLRADAVDAVLLREDKQL